MSFLNRAHVALTTFSLALAIAGPVYAAQKVVPPDPTADKLMLTAGFLEHHQDMKYRLMGLEAYGKRDFENALRFFRRAGYFADKPSQGMVAEMYWKGEGTARDPVQAYVWMDLAAERGYRGFLGLREQYWAALSEAERARAVNEGQQIYARYGDAAAKPRYEWQLRLGRKEIVGSRTGYTGNVQIEVPGPGGMQSIPGSKFYDERYWDAKKYWAWQDKVWMKPRIGRISIGEIEVTSKGAEATRIPQVAPQIDAPVPDVEEPVPPKTP